MGALPDIGGGLYQCIANGQPRILRWGYHRKNNDRNWSDPPGYSLPVEQRVHLPFPSALWYGWRDHVNLRFLRPNEVSSWLELTEHDAVPCSADQAQGEG